jgi:hypothetical protein
MNNAQKATAKLSIDGLSSYSGTAWLLDAKYALTAAHCIGNEETQELFSSKKNPNYPIRLQFDGWSVNAKVIRHDVTIDAALLELETAAKPSQAAIPLGNLPKLSVWPSSKYRWSAWGYASGNQEGLTLSGEITERNGKVEEGVSALQLSCQQGGFTGIEGASGSAVCVHGIAVGIVRSGPKKFKGAVTHAVSLESLQALGWSELDPYFLSWDDFIFALTQDLSVKFLAGYLDAVDLAQEFKNPTHREEVTDLFKKVSREVAKQLSNSLLRTFEAATNNATTSLYQIKKDLFPHLKPHEFSRSQDLSAKARADGKDTSALVLALRKESLVFEESPFPIRDDFHTRLLYSLVRYLAGIAHSLPDLVPGKELFNLQRLKYFESRDLASTLQQLKQVEAQTAENNQNKDEQYEIDYRLFVIRNYRYLELFGAELSTEAKQQELSVAYLSLQLSQSQGIPQPVEKIFEEVLHREKPGRLMIYGPAGAGKSTLFRWLATYAAGFGEQEKITRILEDEQERSVTVSKARETHWYHRVPFLIRLRDCTSGELPGPENVISLISKYVGKPPEGWVQSMLTRGALLLLDGIDEIPKDHRETTKQQLQELTNAFPNTYFVVSSRPEAIGAKWARGFTEANLEPLSLREAERLVDQWHLAVQRNYTQHREESGANKFQALAADIKRKLSETPSLARLASNPLLCAMLCAIHYRVDGHLPNTENEICESLCKVLLHQKSEIGGLKGKEFNVTYAALTFEQKKLMIQKIACHMVKNELSVIPRVEAENTVKHSLPLLGLGAADEALLFQGLLERSGLLREQQPNQVEFIHNTLKEFLAAKEFVNLGDSVLLASKCREAAWRNVILFAIAQGSAAFVNPLVGKVLAVEGLRKEDQQIQKAFAIRCRSVATQLAAELREKIEAIVKSFFPLQSLSHAEWISHAGDSVLSQLEIAAQDTHAIRRRKARALSLIGSYQAKERLRALTEETSLDIVAEVVRALDPLEMTFVRNLLQQNAAGFERFRPLIKGVNALVGMTGLTKLDLSETQVSDLSPLAGLTGLTHLNLMQTQVSDLSPLAGLTGLTHLNLMQTQVSDLSPLAGLTGLTMLDLSGTQVSDLSPLAGMTGLTELYLHGTEVSDLSPLHHLKGLRIFK